MNIKSITFGFLALVLLAGCNNSDSDLNRSVTFETIEKDLYSGVDTPQNVVITNINDWKELWDETVTWTPDELPFVNFNESMVVAVFMGERISGGFNIEVLEIKEADNVIQVISRVTNPDSSRGVTLALTQPFHMIKINKTSKEIIFSELH